MHISNKYSIYFQNILNIYSIYEYNIPFNKHFKKILRNGFLQNNDNGTSEMAKMGVCPALPVANTLKTDQKAQNLLG